MENSAPQDSPTKPNTPSSSHATHQAGTQGSNQTYQGQHSTPPDIGAPNPQLFPAGEDGRPTLPPLITFSSRASDSDMSGHIQPRPDGRTPSVPDAAQPSTSRAMTSSGDQDPNLPHGTGKSAAGLRTPNEDWCNRQDMLLLHIWAGEGSAAQKTEIFNAVAGTSRSSGALSTRRSNLRKDGRPAVPLRHGDALSVESETHRVLRGTSLATTQWTSAEIQWLYSTFAFGRKEQTNAELEADFKNAIGRSRTIVSIHQKWKEIQVAKPESAQGVLDDLSPGLEVKLMAILSKFQDGMTRSEKDALVEEWRRGTGIVVTFEALLHKYLAVKASRGG